MKKKENQRRVLTDNRTGRYSSLVFCILKNAKFPVRNPFIYVDKLLEKVIIKGSE